MKKNNFKHAFTLVELMVFFIFVSLLLAASTPLITKKAKNLPIKYHHGKFVCYGDSYEYYNSTHLVSSGAGCKFRPPKRASLFKIELVGGGAGGTEYSDWDEDMATRSGGFTLSGGAYGDGYTNMSDGEIYDMLYQAPFIYAVEGTDGGHGQDTDPRTYTGVGSPHMVLTGACSKKCWSPSAYACQQTGKRYKYDSDGHILKDENGDYVYEEYTYDTFCYTTQAEDNALDIPTCSSCDSLMSRLYDIQSEIINNQYCGELDWCYNIATSSFSQPYRDRASNVTDGESKGAIDNFGTLSEAIGRGARGGYGQDFYIKGTIDFCDYSKGGKCLGGSASNEYKRVMGGSLNFSYGQTMDDGQKCSKKTGCSMYVDGTGVRPYLANLFGVYLEKGTTMAKGSCEGWKTKKFKEYPETKKGSSRDSYMHGQDGNDVLHYDALKTWGDNCTTNVERAKGGEGGWYKDTGETIYGTSGTNLGGTLRAPYDADKFGIINKSNPWPAIEGLERDRIPWLTTSTTLNEKWHEVGNGGGAASYKIAYTSSIDNDCVFDVAKGGPAIVKGMTGAQLESIHEGLTTSLTCNHGTLHLVAEGGKYNTDTYIKTYSGFDYMTSGGAFTNPETFVTSDKGEDSKFSPKDVYTKYIIGKYGFGAGGRGTEITDYCTRPYGEWTVNRVYYDGIDKTDHQDWPKSACKGVTLSTAQSGSPGVIIISW